MGQTIIEKIIAAHCGRKVQPGEIVWLELDIVSARDFGGPNVVKNYEREYGDQPVFDPDRVVFTFDLCVPACTLK
ncbi:MAG: homoaconitate hydratase family protein, partial [Candidatus Aminicenantes bacterium]